MKNFDRVYELRYRSSEGDGDKPSFIVSLANDGDMDFSILVHKKEKSYDFKTYYERLVMLDDVSVGPFMYDDTIYACANKIIAELLFTSKTKIVDQVNITRTSGIHNTYHMNILQKGTDDFNTTYVKRTDIIPCSEISEPYSPEYRKSGLVHVAWLLQEDMVNLKLISNE